MKRDIKERVEQCEVCQKNKFETPALAGLLQPLPIIPRQVWFDISMDFINGQPRVQEKDNSGGGRSVNQICPFSRPGSPFHSKRHSTFVRQRNCEAP